MSKLYELTQNYNNLMELLDNPEIPQELINNALKEVTEDIENKSENLCKVIRMMELDVTTFKEEEKRLSSKRKSLENRIKNLKEYLQTSMESVGKNKIEGKLFKIQIQNNKPTVKIIDENKIPELYKTEETIIKVDKNSLYDLMKNGKQIEGVELKQSKSLRIR